MLRENFCSLITIVLDFSLLCWFCRLGAPDILDLSSVVITTASAPANQITPHSNVMVYMEFPKNIEGTSAKKDEVFASTRHEDKEESLERSLHHDDGSVRLFRPRVCWWLCLHRAGRRMNSWKYSQHDRNKPQK